MAAIAASCAGSGDGTVKPPADVPARGDRTSGEQWAGREVSGLPDGSWLWDVAAAESGVLVAVGTIASSGDVPLIVWRSEDGSSWRQVFRYRRDLGLESAFVMPRAAVTAHGDGFAIVSSICDERCVPFALHSATGSTWDEVEVPGRPRPRGKALRGRPGGGGAVAMGAAPGVGAARLVLGTPGFELDGAAMTDVVATPSRLVAVGWAESGEYTTAGAVWLSDDGGRSWRLAPEGAIPQGDAQGPDPDLAGLEDRKQLDKIVLVGDRLVASGGNRCCYDQAVGEVWVSDAAGERWRRVAVPEEAVNVEGLVAAGDAVHLFGRTSLHAARQTRLHWRLSADDRWERLDPAPVDERFLGGAGGLVAVDSETTAPEGGPRLVLYHSSDGKRFRVARASGPREALQLEVAVIAGGRVLAYATTGGQGEGEYHRRLLFEAPAAQGVPHDGRAVWAARARPSPVLFGEGVRVPGEGGRFVDVTPAQKAPTDLVVDAFFVDPDHGWALLADSDSQSRRLVLTTDGGRHWSPGGLGPTPEPARSLFFTDRSNGWVAAFSVAESATSLYRTTDGGRTWSGPSPTPACGAVHFDTARHGWLPHPGNGRENCGRMGLHETADGGRTWSERQVPPPGAGREGRYAGYGAPRFHSSVLPVWLSEGDRSRVAFSVSEDQGRTWSFAAAVDFPKGERPPQASVAGKRVWWATDGDGSRVAVTTDGGKRWRHVPASGVRGRLASLEGLDERRAWAVEVSSEGARLVETGDGGATWHQLVDG